MTRSSASFAERAERRASRRICFGMSCSYERGCGPKTTPPPFHCGDADRALAGAACPLLAPRLAATAANFAAGLGFVRAEAGIRQLANQRLVHHRNIGFDAPDGIVEVDRAHDFSLEVVHDQLASSFLLHGSHRDLARPDYLRPLTARLISSVPLFGPGTDPSTSSRLRSASTRSTVRFCTVTRSLPM